MGVKGRFNVELKGSVEIEKKGKIKPKISVIAYRLK